MSEKKAIEIIKNTPLLRYEGQCGLHSDLGDAMRMAVEALEKQTMCNEILNDWNEAREKAIDEFFDEVLNFEDYIEPITDDNGILLYSGCDITDMIVKIKKKMKGEEHE